MVWGAIICSVLAILWLAWRNPKRRRTQGLALHSNVRPAWPGWVIGLAPGAVLLCFAGSADVVNWIAALCAFGWIAVAVRPATWADWVSWLDHQGNRFENYIQNRLG